VQRVKSVTGQVDASGHIKGAQKRRQIRTVGYRACRRQPQDFTNPLLGTVWDLANCRTCRPAGRHTLAPQRPQPSPGWGRFSSWNDVSGGRLFKRAAAVRRGTTRPCQAASVREEDWGRCFLFGTDVGVATFIGACRSLPIGAFHGKLSDRPQPAPGWGRFFWANPMSKVDHHSLPEAS